MKITRFTKIRELRNMEKFLYKLKREWENQVKKSGPRMRGSDGGGITDINSFVIREFLFIIRNPIWPIPVAARSKA